MFECVVQEVQSLFTCCFEWAMFECVVQEVQTLFTCCFEFVLGNLFLYLQMPHVQEGFFTFWTLIAHTLHHSLLHLEHV